MKYSITHEDYSEFIENLPENKVSLIWEHIIEKLKPELQQEARMQEFILELVDDDDLFKPIKFKFRVIDASLELNAALDKIDCTVNLVS